MFRRQSLSRLLPSGLPFRRQPVGRLPFGGRPADRPLDGHPVSRPLDGHPVSRPLDGHPIGRLRLGGNPLDRLRLGGNPLDRLPVCGHPLRRLRVRRIWVRGLLASGPGSIYLAGRCLTSCGGLVGRGRSLAEYRAVQVVHYAVEGIDGRTPWPMRLGFG